MPDPLFPAPGRVDWDALDAFKFADESEAIARVSALHALTPADRAGIHAEAVALVETARGSARKQGVVESFLQEFALGTQEGLALMCLAEALLRTPDAEGRDRLIAETIGRADWASHRGQSESLFVNASTWGLMLTGRIVDVADDAKADAPGFFRRLTTRVGEPVIRAAVTAAVRIMGEQFVLGRDIDAALARARREGMVCSFDMLGEGARTEADAERYHRLYGTAIAAVGAANSDGPEAGHGVSVKLSALCPRYEAVQEAYVVRTLYPRMLDLAQAAARADINLAIDAEEADRLVISLRLVERLAAEPSLGAWRGLGVVVQAYQKRAPQVIAGLARVAQSSGRRIMVRLVKGAYWDSEIKAAQVNGQAGYPVYTTKAATDVSYLGCARALIAAAPALYPQFATHNAHTLAAVRSMAQQAGVTIEHQRLHGMGEALYEAAQGRYGAIRVRAYAPVGGHEELLPYLVRRLLENGANSSFVHQLLDRDVPAGAVVADPIAAVEAAPGPNLRIPLPRDLYGTARANSAGRDLAQAGERARLARAVADVDAATLYAGPIVDGALREGGASQPVRSPADVARVVGHVAAAGDADLNAAVAATRAAWPAWDAAGGVARARVLVAMGDALEAAGDRLIGILVREGGKTYPDAIAELREAADFCRYYAHLAREDFAGPRHLAGPAGEVNTWALGGRGVFACISPWNFPLAIFTGQIAAALAAGNAVIAKPAEQTPLIAAEAVRLFLAAGLPAGVLALLPGEGGAIGAALVAHPGIDGVAFTGGTDTAWAINRSLAARQGPIIPFIAETGGLNAMFVDTTALKEQVIDDVILSAFGSAGQRCSALRVLFVPEASAEGLIEGLKGALATRVLGDPADSATDIGPVIDAEAKAGLERHLAHLKTEATILDRHPGTAATGHYFAPVIAEIPAPDFLEREVFGPVLHICRYGPGQLGDYARRLAARGYGLTLGIHSRLDGFAAEVQALVPAGNVYVNRGMTGAVVGVQPFGGLGLSGTGPKAGGPHALHRFATERSVSVNIMARGGDPRLLAL